MKMTLQTWISQVGIGTHTTHETHEDGYEVASAYCDPLGRRVTWLWHPETGDVVPDDAPNLEVEA